MPGRTESGDRAAVVRTVAVVAMLFLAATALRGYLPGADRAVEQQNAGGGSGSIVAVIAMLTVSLAALAISILAQAMTRPRTPSAAVLPRSVGSERGARRWRPLVIAALVLVAWTLLMLMLMRWASGHTIGGTIDAPPAAADPGTPAQEEISGDGPPPLPDAEDDGAGLMFGVLACASAAMLVLALVAALRRRRRTAPDNRAIAGAADPQTTPAAVAAPPDLARAAELGLAEMDDPTRDPREAIIACYLAMERELEKSPGTTPQDSDTPSEVLARAIEVQALQADSAIELVDLFEEARFSPHVMHDGHRADAVRALRAVQRDLEVAR